jgi:hypothetical protein
LTRIELFALSCLSLETIIIPRNVQFIDSFTFLGVRLSSISIESGNKLIVIGKHILIDILRHKLIRDFSESS